MYLWPGTSNPCSNPCHLNYWRVGLLVIYSLYGGNMKTEVYSNWLTRVVFSFSVLFSSTWSLRNLGVERAEKWGNVNCIALRGTRFKAREGSAVGAGRATARKTTGMVQALWVQETKERKYRKNKYGCFRSDWARNRSKEPHGFPSVTDLSAGEEWA